MTRRFFLAALLAIHVLIVPAALGQRRESPSKAAAQAQLEAAGAMRRALRGARGSARTQLRARAVEAYREVRTRFPRERALGAEAAFRAGELLRASGRGEAAAAEFRSARALGEGTPFRARAGLELGHLARRADLLAEALEAYRSVVAAPGTPPAQRDEARLWVGRTAAGMGRVDEARSVLERAALSAEDPCDRIAAHDELALLWIAAGDLEAAAGELERCRVAQREMAREATPLGERVRSALRRMRALGRLREAVARRREGVVVER